VAAAQALVFVPAAACIRAAGAGTRAAVARAVAVVRVVVATAVAATKVVKAVEDRV